MIIWPFVLAGDRAPGGEHVKSMSRATFSCVWCVLCLATPSKIIDSFRRYVHVRTDRFFSCHMMSASCGRTVMCLTARQMRLKTPCIGEKMFKNECSVCVDDWLGTHNTVDARQSMPSSL